MIIDKNSKLNAAIAEELIAKTTIYDSRVITTPKIYGKLNHEPTKTSLPCYKPIGWFKRLMLNWCFGLKYKKQ